MEKSKVEGRRSKNGGASHSGSAALTLDFRTLRPVAETGSAGDVAGDPVFGMPGGVGNGQNPNDFVVDGVGEVIRENLEIDAPEAHGAKPRQLGMSGIQASADLTSCFRRTPNPDSMDS